MCPSQRTDSSVDRPTVLLCNLLEYKGCSASARAAGVLLLMADDAARDKAGGNQTPKLMQDVNLLLLS